MHFFFVDFFLFGAGGDGEAEPIPRREGGEEKCWWWICLCLRRVCE